VAKSIDAVVVDASTLLALILPESKDRRLYALALARAAENGRVRLLIPQVCQLEMAAVLSRKVRAGVIAEVAAREFFAEVDSLALETIVETYHAQELFDLALQLGTQVGDAIYLRMARDMGASVASLDGGMTQGAAASGVAMFTPKA
jgi:predicted nucleic acid-binding protein